MKTVNLEAILGEHYSRMNPDGGEYRTHEDIITAMREAGNQIVDLCAENSTTELTNTCIRVDKQSILNTKSQII